ncbi:NAD-dependent epimerase/dehydratase family protein [Cellulomonas sp. S1-8]|uniref:polysaccharide biosynthesis C-terminal domain-containing protein n=1 Tax=Cellulomonas sp. S1-8 TaxID=2904790 RepID=UPI002244E184|nr:NAD-dependent epimerase/dehydratase family protein [Cellulomonas sp. S1-8]UZN04141.1 NAD-dependent epimerase/dehydratase family protein [Cellulomonas sp. S1-8]
MKVVVTGAEGFLGWHTRLRLRATTDHEVVPVSRSTWGALPALVAGADAVLHLAGVNRGADDDVADGNARLARDVADALAGAAPGVRVVYANSIQAGNGSPYGTGKAEAASTLRDAVARLGGTFVDMHLPNIFGEHGRPQYNSFVATFVHAVIRGEAPQVEDRPVELLHAQGAARALVDGLDGESREERPAGAPATVAGVLAALQDFDALYRVGDIPALPDAFHRDLFNTLRAATFPDRAPLRLTPRADHRGNLVEVVRVHGGQGQTFVSSTRPGVTRGEHFHLRKMERFVVIGGRASISLRRVFHDDVITFDVSGDEPVAVDMPIGWAHNITNTGDGELTTLFWTSELFDPADPDTVPEPVGSPTRENE